jgi:hypothetical protein
MKAQYTKEILGKCHLSTILHQPNILEESYSEKSCMNWLVLFSQVIILSLKFAVDILITALNFDSNCIAYKGLMYDIEDSWKHQVGLLVKDSGIG